MRCLTLCFPCLFFFFFWSSWIHWFTFFTKSGNFSAIIFIAPTPLPGTLVSCMLDCITQKVRWDSAQFFSYSFFVFFSTLIIFVAISSSLLQYFYSIYSIFILETAMWNFYILHFSPYRVCIFLNILERIFHIYIAVLRSFSSNFFLSVLFWNCYILCISSNFCFHARLFDIFVGGFGFIPLKNVVFYSIVQMSNLQISWTL